MHQNSPSLQKILLKITRATKIKNFKQKKAKNNVKIRAKAQIYITGEGPHNKAKIAPNARNFGKKKAELGQKLP